MTDAQNLDPRKLTAPELRAMGVDDPNTRDDRDLVESVELLLDIGCTLDDLVGVSFGEASLAHRLRPETWHGPDFDARLASVDVDAEFSQRLRAAMGFAPGSGMGLTPTELEATQFFASLRELMSEEEVLGLLRVVGLSASRVARATTTQLRLSVEAPLGDTGRLVDVLRAYDAITEQALPRFLEANNTILKRHFADLLRTDPAWQADQSHSATMQDLVVGFADLIGFTAFTEQADARQFMKAMVQFEADVQQAVIDNGGVLVKLIGDAVMFVAHDAPAAVVIGRALGDLGAKLPHLDGMRVGLASGSVIASGGDYYGTIVNIASRIVQEADSNVIVMTEAVAKDLASAASAASIGNRDIRGIRQSQHLYRLQL